MHPVAFTSPAPRRRPGARARGRIVCRLLLPICLAVLGTVSACARSSRTAATDEVPSEITQLRVQNQAFLDMNIYVLRGAERVRIGQATSNTTTTLRIPPSLLTGPTPLRFLADPIGSSRTPVSSEMLVKPGEEVQMTIPPS